MQLPEHLWTPVNKFMNRCTNATEGVCNGTLWTAAKSAVNSFDMCVDAKGLCACRTPLSAAAHLAGKCGLKMINAEVEQALQMCSGSGSGCAGVAPASAAVEACMKHTGNNTCACVGAFRQLGHAVSSCDMPEFASVAHSVKSVMTMCVACNSTRIQPAIQAAAKCAAAMWASPCDCVPFYTQALHAASNCPYYELTSWQHMVQKCKAQPPSKAEVCQKCGTWPWSGSCGDVVGTYCRAVDSSSDGEDDKEESDDMSFCDTCKENPVVTTRDSPCFADLHDFCEECSDAEVVHTSTALATCLELQSSPCKCTDAFATARAVAQRCDTHVPANMTAAVQPCFLGCNMTKVHRSAYRLQRCLGSKPTCQCAVPFYDLQANMDACVGNPVLDGYRPPVDMQGLQTMLGRCTGTDTTNSTSGTGDNGTGGNNNNNNNNNNNTLSCTKTYVNALSLDVQECVLAKDLCSCRPLGDRLQGVLDACLMPNEVAVWDFSACASPMAGGNATNNNNGTTTGNHTSGSGPRPGGGSNVTVAPLYTGVCHACRNFSHPMCGQARRAYCSAPFAEKELDMCTDCTGGQSDASSGSCREAVEDACGELGPGGSCPAAAYSSARGVLERCLQTKAPCHCMFEAQGFKAVSDECDMPLPGWLENLVDNSASLCPDTSRCNMTVLRRTQHRLTNCTRTQPPCSCMGYVESYKGLAAACAFQVSTPEVKTLEDLCTVSAGCDLMAPLVEDVSGCLHDKSPCECRDVVASVFQGARNCSLWKPEPALVDLRDSIRAMCDGTVNMCTLPRLNATVRRLDRCLQRPGRGGVCNCTSLFRNASRDLAKCREFTMGPNGEDPTAPWRHRVNALAELFQQACGNSDTCALSAAGRAHNAALRCLQTQPRCNCTAPVMKLEAELARCGETLPVALARGVKNFCGPDGPGGPGGSTTGGAATSNATVLEVCTQCATLNPPAECATFVKQVCAGPHPPTACQVCSPTTLKTMTCMQQIQGLCSSCNMIDILTKRSAYESCAAKTSPCKCRAQWGALKAVVSGCSSVDMPSAFWHALDTCNAASAVCDAAQLSSMSHALYGCMDGQSLCACAPRMLSYEQALQRCGQSMPSALVKAFDTCGMKQCNATRLEATKAAVTSCMEDKPACECRPAFKQLVAAANDCATTPAAFLSSVFAACDGGSDQHGGGDDGECNTAAVEETSQAAWGCVMDRPACECKAKVEAARGAAEKCDAQLEGGLKKLVEQSCGEEEEGVTATRDSVCEDCTSLSALGSVPDCKEQAQSFCGAGSNTSTHAFCKACFPIPTLSCSTAFRGLCSNCDWAKFKSASEELDECLHDNSPCECAEQVDALKGLGSDCPALPSYLATQMSSCKQFEACDNAGLNASFVALRACQADAPLCTCTEEYDDYAGLAHECGVAVSPTVVSQFKACSDGNSCVAGVEAAFVDLDGCMRKAQDVCVCQGRMKEWEELAEVCGMAGDEALEDKFEGCGKTGGGGDSSNAASFVEFVSQSYLAKEEAGVATVAVRRFGGAGAAATRAARLLLAVYRRDGSFTGLNRVVQWAAGDMATKSVSIPFRAFFTSGSVGFTVEISEASGVVFGELDETEVVVQPKAVERKVQVHYPSRRVVWHANATRHVAWGATGFDADSNAGDDSAAAASASSFYVDLLKAGTKVLRLGTGGLDGRLGVTLPSSLAPGSDYTVEVSYADAPVDAPVKGVSGAFTIEAPIASTVTRAFIRAKLVQGGASSGNASSPIVAWLGLEMQIKLDMHSNNPEDDEVALAVVDGDGAIVDIINRWSAKRVPSSVKWRVPLSLERQVAPTYRIAAYMFVDNDFLLHETQAFAAQPPVELRTSPWGACSAPCGPGQQRRTVSCVKVFDGSGDATNVGNCMFFDDMPERTRSCFVKPCTTYGFTASAWSACSRSCGSGKQERTVECLDSTGQTVADDKCLAANQTRLAATRPCPGLKPCEKYDWVSTRWLGCSAKCGGGHQVRIVLCAGNRGSISQDGSLCLAADRPVSRRACNEQPCTEYEWYAGRWSRCSAKCGGGTRNRTTACMNTVTEPWTVAGEDNCPAEGRPVSERDCNTVPCPEQRVEWSYGAWGACNAPCGGGNRTRNATCLDGARNPVPDSRCVEAGREAKTRVPCNSRPCDPCANVRCQNNGTCVAGQCQCTPQWSGRLCLAPVTCPSGVVDKNLTCCPSGVVSRGTGACCTNTTAAPPVLDRRGACCSVGVVDACRVCNGTGIGFDRRGRCCSGVDVAFDASRTCCAKSDIDACGVCGGDGLSCKLRVDLQLKAPANFTVEELLTEGSFARCVAGLWLVCGWWRVGLVLVVVVVFVCAFVCLCLFVRSFVAVAGTRKWLTCHVCCMWCVCATWINFVLQLEVPGTSLPREDGTPVENPSVPRHWQEHHRGEQPTPADG